MYQQPKSRVIHRRCGRSMIGQWFCMEIWEIAAYAFGAVLIAVLILRCSNYEAEKPEDIEFK